MRAVITVMGKDQTGIIARVSQLLFQRNVNILDINQTILDDIFTMVMLVDTPDVDAEFDALQKELLAKGKEMNVEVRAQRTEIFDAMNII